jgi:hypothetical protein
MARDLAMSREHFQLDNQPPHCHLVDLGSTNGTKVNGLRVGKVLLREGDVIEAGDTEFVVHFDEDSEIADHFATCSGCGNRIPLPPKSSGSHEAIRLCDDSSFDQREVRLCDACEARRLRFPETDPDYLIEEWIGGGGMGEVYRAWQLSKNRRVAIKMISGNSAMGEKAAGYFRREIEVLRDLLMPSGRCHHSIVAFYEI